MRKKLGVLSTVAAVCVLILLLIRALYDNNALRVTDADGNSKDSAPISPQSYQQLLGKGMDEDWCKTSEGMKCYTEKAVQDFKNAGISHVRIRIKDEADEELFKVLDRQIEDCINNGIIPVIAYQADDMKNNPDEQNIENTVKWWGTVAQRYQNLPYELSFDLIIEVTDALNQEPELLNKIYERVVSEIRKTNPERIIMISPRLRSDPEYLKDLKIPTEANGFLMAECHFYAAGSSKTNPKKLWTTGTQAEKNIILNKINSAVQWQTDTGIPVWVGAWMPGNYNDGNDYSVEEQVKFAGFMRESLEEANIPFAVNSDTKFYDRQAQHWIYDMQPVFESIFK